ncbi:MAG: oligosaccharide flippase family protein [Anaeromyxobacteraceae bacterium]
MPESLLSRARPLLVARLAGAALTVAVPMILARVLAPASYGTFKQAWLLAQTLALVLPMGTTLSLYYFLPRDPLRRDRYVAQTSLAHAVLGAVAALALLAAAPLVHAWSGNPELARVLPLVAGLAGLQIAGAPLDVAWNARGLVGRAALARVGTEVARGGGMLAGALLLGRYAEGVLTGILWVHAARALASVACLAWEHGLVFDRATARRQAAYALPFGAAFLLLVPQQQLHQYAVAAIVPAATFAVYAVGMFQLPIVDILHTPVAELLQIGIADSDGAGRPPRAALPLFHEAVGQLAFAFVPLTALLVVVARPLVELLFSARYLDAVPLFRIGTLAVVLAALPLDGVLRARAENRYMLGLSAVKLAGTALLVFSGLWTFGPIGAISGHVLAEAGARAAMLGRAAESFEVGAREILPWRALARQLAASGLAAGAAAGALAVVAGAPLVRLLAAGSAFAVAYLAATLASGGLPAAWLDLFRRPAATARAAPGASE